MSKENPRSLQIIDSLGMGGAETWLMEVLRLWSVSGAAKMDFLVTSGETGIFDEEAEGLGAKVFYCKFGVANWFSFARTFRRILRKGRYDAIHDHQDFASGWHFLLGGRFLPPVRVTHVHNPSYQILNNYGVTARRRLLSRIGKSLVGRFATHITGTSQQVLREYGFMSEVFHRQQTFPLHCGFNCKRFSGDRKKARAAILGEFDWPPETKLILFAGRLDCSNDPNHPQTHKNSGFATDVAIESIKLDERVRAVFVGRRQPAVLELRERVDASGLSGKIVFAGMRKDIERLMLAADVLLFPSRAEGLGMVAVEAQAVGLPVLASTAVPNECAVVNGLVTFKDVSSGPEAWAHKLKSLLTFSRELDEPNRQVSASAFSIDNSASTLLELYSSGCDFAS